MAKTLRPIPMERMLEYTARELEMSSSVFSVSPGFRADARLPLGVAAGPCARMAQSLVAAYVAGARSFELPAQIGGALTPDQVLEEYVKARVAMGLLDRELGLGCPDGPIFVVRLAADSAALAEPEMADFLKNMADVSKNPVWQNCRQAAQAALRRFNNLEREDLDAIDPHLCRTVSLSWTDLGEMERCARYFIGELGWNVYLDLDATALGTVGIGGCLAAQGGEDCPVDHAAFGPNLEELSPVVNRLRHIAQDNNRTLGIRVSGGLPLVGGGRLSGAAAAPLDLLLCARLAAKWPGLPLVWAGECDYFNIGQLSRLGFRAVAVGETLLRPGGYLRLRQLGRAAAGAARSNQVDAREAEDMARGWSRRSRYRLDRQEPQRVRVPGKAPLTDCFIAPCQAGCPFGEDISGALRLMSDGRYRDALRVILDRNPLPNLTGAVCPQPCGGRCTRIFYDQAVQVRQAEALCAQRAWGDMLARLDRPEPRVGLRVAVVGGSPGGMAAAFLLARRGVAVSLFEVASQLCPGLRRAQPELGQLVDRDAQLLTAMGVDLRLNTAAPADLTPPRGGYSHVVLAPEEPGMAQQIALPGAGESDALTGDNERVFVLTPPTDAVGGVARAIADAHAVAETLLGPATPCDHPAGRRGGAMGKKGKVCPAGSGPEEWERCLECATVCECCVDACPTRANVPITVPTRATPQILHLDGLCAHCGVCAAYCPYESDPGRDKFTLFETAEDFAGSENAGFVVLDFLARKVRLRLDGEVRDLSLKDSDPWAPSPIRELVETVFIDYPYLLDTHRRKESDQVSLWEERG